MILSAVDLKRLLRVEDFVADVARNLLALLVRDGNVEGEVVSREVFLWAVGVGAFEVFDFCVGLKES